jgi:hypothetical protein
VNQLSEQDLQLQVTIVGWLQIVSNAILVILGLCGFVFLVGIGFIPLADSGDPVGLTILGLIGTIGLAFFGLLALPGILAGYGLLKRERWGQILGIIVGFLGLVNFPVGTAIGAYTLFVLFQDSANEYFAGEELV